MSETQSWKAGWAWFGGAVTLLICMGGIIWKTSQQSSRLDAVVADMTVVKSQGSDVVRMHIAEDNQIERDHKDRLTRLEQAALQNSVEHSAIMSELASIKATQKMVVELLQKKP